MLFQQAYFQGLKNQLNNHPSVQNQVYYRIVNLEVHNRDLIGTDRPEDRGSRDR
jgi:hypothetical protein